jgi:heme/copper-type cytochrome/quinol oxidase subunit 2
LDPRTRENAVIVVLMVAAVALSGLLGFYSSTIANSLTASSQPSATVVNMDVIPDYGGAGYDAFVLAANADSGIVPAPATNTTAPGANDNNVTVKAGTTVDFVLTTIDTAVLQNFSDVVSTPFTVYNDTASGVVASHYGQGQNITNMPIGHTFTITQLGLNIPIPPTTVVNFSVTFSKAGTYMFTCDTPCGPGMGLNGYMQGYVIVT